MHNKQSKDRTRITIATSKELEKKLKAEVERRRAFGAHARLALVL